MLSNQSAVELEILIHYKELDNKSGPWTGTRIRNLCNVLNLTQAELARFIRLTPHRLQFYIEKGKFPSCIKLVLDLLERSSHRTYLGKAYFRSLFPNLY